MLLVYALTSALLLCPVHEGKHEQIDAATAAIEASPTNVNLRLARAEIYLQHQELQSCAEDLDLAQQLAPQASTLLWLRARLDFAQANFDASLKRTDEFLSLKLVGEKRQAALVLRAQNLTEIARTAVAQKEIAQTEMAKKELAVSAWSLAIKENDRVLPDWYLARATMEDSLETAIPGLDQGIKRLGPVVSLLLRAAEYEEQLGRIDDALARIQSLADQSPRKETWLKKQGDILSRAKQFERAQAKYRQAMEAWLQLSEKRRNTPSMQRLLQEIEHCIAKGEEAPGGERHE